jgi:hypothetical protein
MQSTEWIYDLPPTCEMTTISGSSDVEEEHEPSPAEWAMMEHRYDERMDACRRWWNRLQEMRTYRGAELGQYLTYDALWAFVVRHTK